MHFSRIVATTSPFKIADRHHILLLFVFFFFMIDLLLSIFLPNLTTPKYRAVIISLLKDQVRYP